MKNFLVTSILNNIWHLSNIKLMRNIVPKSKEQQAPKSKMDLPSIAKLPQHFQVRILEIEGIKICWNQTNLEIMHLSFGKRKNKQNDWNILLCLKFVDIILGYEDCNKNRKDKQINEK